MNIELTAQQINNLISILDTYTFPPGTSMDNGRVLIIAAGEIKTAIQKASVQEQIEAVNEELPEENTED